jgi:hypothetical protein
MHPKRFNFTQIESFASNSIDWARATGNIKYYLRHDSGGHFAAVENPDVLVADLQEFIKIVKRESRD